MARRYGRNQKRAHRARIAELEDAARRLAVENLMLAGDVQVAELLAEGYRAHALNEWLNREEEVRDHRDALIASLVGAVEPELRRYAQMMLDADRVWRERPLHISAYVEPSFTQPDDVYVVIQAELPRLRCALRVRK